jgi:hypothetical protein
MSSKFPTAVDDAVSLPDPSAANATNSPSHAGLHDNTNSAIKAIEAKLGTGTSVPAANTILFGTGAGTSAFQTLTSAQLASVLTDETGTGANVFATSPTLITPKVDTIGESTPGNGVTVGGVGLKTGIVTGSLTGALNSAGVVTKANLGSAIVDGSKVDWSATGASGGIWWEELQRTTLGVAGDTIAVPTFTARKNLLVLWCCLPSGGTITAKTTFNADTAANYANRQSDNGAADATQVSQNSLFWDATTVNGSFYGYAYISNISTQEKIAVGQVVGRNTAGAANAPIKRDHTGKWANTAAQITSLSILNDAAGDFAAASYCVVLGHD